ncbi:MAG: sulfate permease [Actinomycetota bacterium]|nr:sulfate permease [Actinomycetota bacterium]
MVPAAGWLRGYGREDLSRDFSAALVITVMLVPQSMAYALLAGLPPIYGLYASTVPAIVYAVFGTSRHMPVGPPALMALLTFTSVSAIAKPGTDEYIGYVLLLAFMVGMLQLALGLLRMGFLTNFISHPVLSGFIYASAVIIALSQVKHFLGIEASDDHSTLGMLASIIQKIENTNWIPLAIGLLSVTAIVLLGKFAPRIPGALVAVVAATLAVYLLSLGNRGVDIVGEVPRGLPQLSVPALDFEVMRTLVPAALIVAFVGFIESISVAKAIAAREKYKIDSNQELRALGLANVGAAFFSGFPVAGSFSRTAVQYQSGGRTQMASIITALMVIATLLVLTPLFYYLPNAALAAVIVVAVYKLLDFREARYMFKIRGADGLTLLITFLVTLLVGIEQGIIAGATFALLAFLRRTAYPEIIELGYVEKEETFKGLRSYPEARTFPEALIMRFDARLYFANIPFLEEYLISEIPDRPKLEYVIIDCRGINGIDVTALEGLEDLISEYQARNIKILFAHMKKQIRERLRKSGWEQKFGDICYPTTRDALRDIGLLEEHETSDPGVR